MDNYSGLYNRDQPNPDTFRLQLHVFTCIRKKGEFGINTHVGLVCLFQPEYSHT